MKFHREGKQTLILALIIGILLVAAAYIFLDTPFLEILILVAIAILVLVLQFFRDPVRKISLEDHKKIYAPADGKVVVIEKVVESEFLNQECIQVSIFMSPVNVHINRNPVSGIVTDLKYFPGKYLAAWNPKSSLDNERFITVYEVNGQKILMRQIAGALARRIVNYLEKGQKVKQGHEMGFIKFGSRVDVLLPVNARILVSVGQRVVSPIDVLAEL